jgi:hypothetical protein
MSLKSYSEMNAEQRFVYRMGEKWLVPVVQTTYDELQDLNKEWFELDDNAKRVWVQNALGVLAGAILEMEERDGDV